MKEKSIIRKVGNQWCVYYGDKKDCFDTPQGAKRRLIEVEMFKHMKSSTYECICRDCDEQFTSHVRCDQSKCPSCGSYDAEEIRGEIN